MKKVKCPHCQTVHEITPTEQSQRFDCDWCHKSFRVRPARPEVDAVDPLAELRAARERAVEEIRGRAPVEKDFDEEDVDDDEDVELDDTIERMGFDSRTPEPTAEEMFARRQEKIEAQQREALEDAAARQRDRNWVHPDVLKARAAKYARLDFWAKVHGFFGVFWILVGLLEILVAGADASIIGVLGGVVTVVAGCIVRSLGAIFGGLHEIARELGELHR